jgi:hypothetical protein
MERHTKDMRHAFALIGPRVDIRLEYLHHGAHNVEQDNYPQLARSLQLGDHHQRLNSQGR